MREILRRDRTRAGLAAGAVRLLGAAALAAAWLPQSAEAVDVSAKLGELSRGLAADRTPAGYKALEAHAEASSGLERSLAGYALGMARYADKEYGDAEKRLAAVLGEVGPLNHFAAYFHARCIVLAEDFERALAPLRRFRSEHAGSRFLPAAERLLVESLIRLRRWEQARALVANQGGPLEEPVRLYLAGRVEHLDGNLTRAVRLYREAYYRYPLSDQAAVAESHLDRLRASMGKAYPAAPADWRLERAEKLRGAGRHEQASAEYSRALAAGLGPEDRDRAVVRKGAADYARRSTNQAYSALARARPADPALDAERLYLLSACERRMGLERPMHSSLAKLSQRHADSPWYEEALLTVGNYYYLRDNRKEYPRWFGRLAEAFPKGEHAPYAHWKLCWRAWLDDRSDRGELLTEHVRRFPGAPTASGALFWLGRLHAGEGRSDAAEAHFQAVADAFPHYYYGLLAARELGASGGAGESQAASALAAGLPGRRALAPEPSAATREIFEKAGVLAALGFDEDALFELRRADFRKPDGHLAGREQARLHSRRDEHFLALRAMKRYAFGYLRLPFEALDAESWRYLFPLGWRESLRSRSERHGLDPYLVAALIRQESEFNPAARSSAGALGLMQIMPQTGRSLFRRLGIPGFSSRKLTIPDTSLRLGTFHLKEVLAGFGGELEKALAGYNAGERRISQWMRLGPFDDMQEFVETIPFSETRGYVQAILRNRALYQLLYGG